MYAGETEQNESERGRGKRGRDESSLTHRQFLAQSPAARASITGRVFNVVFMSTARQRWRLFPGSRRRRGTRSGAEGCCTCCCCCLLLLLLLLFLVVVVVVWKAASEELLVEMERTRR